MCVFAPSRLQTSRGHCGLLALPTLRVTTYLARVVGFSALLDDVLACFVRSSRASHMGGPKGS